MAKRPDASVPGIIVVDKPQGLTSHDVVARIRRIARTRKVGHAGTLDPMATGVLVIGIGKATRLLTAITGSTKTYEATIRLGISTLSDDAEGELLEARGCGTLDEDELESAMGELRGDILQQPSKVSAKKIDGKRAYALVREGVEVELAPVPVSILRFERLSEARPASVPTPEGPVPVLDLDVVVDCSSGTYIRALARDLGRALGCGAHLTMLRRTRVASFGIDAARTLDALEAEAREREEARGAGHCEAPEPAPGLLPLDDAVASLLPVLVLSSDEAGRFAHGQAPRRPEAEIAALRERSATVGALDASGRALGLLDASGPRLATLSVFASA